ncbi:MAG: zf-HC2 domain-containing protein [Bacillota bacterium]|nr:zf-HC2 domain-containing protein [Bacillota bacterium]
MMSKECSFIRELLPLFAENLVSEETVEYIKEHLTGCSHCAQEWEMFCRPLPDSIPTEKLYPQKNVEKRLFARLRKTVAASVLLLVIGGAGLAYGSFYAGKHIGMDDPTYRFAQELGLFTEINQTKTIDGLQVTIDKGLFDRTRSVLFIRFSASGEEMPQVSLTDESGYQYEQKSGKGWQNKYFMLEFEPLRLETEQVNVSLTLDDQAEESAEFVFPVDVVKTAQYTTIIYPNQVKELANLKITLEKAVLGVSESQFNVRFDWPTDGSVSGIALGKGMAYFPTSVTKLADAPPPPGFGPLPPDGLMSGYAATYGVNYRSQDPPENRPALYDLTGRQEIQVQWGEYKTTQFPCQVEAILKFAPVEQGTERMELLLPPVYLYEKVEDENGIKLVFREENTINLEKGIAYGEGRVVIEKAWLEKDRVYLSYRLESSDAPDTVLPHFVLKDIRGMEQGKSRFDMEMPQVVVFYLYSEEAKEFHLELESMGHLLSREKFSLDLQDN